MGAATCPFPSSPRKPQDLPRRHAPDGALRCQQRHYSRGRADRLATTPAQCAIRPKGGEGMTERTTKKDNIENLLLAGKSPAEIAETLGVKPRVCSRRCLAHTQFRA